MWIYSCQSCQLALQAGGGALEKEENTRVSLQLFWTLGEGHMSIMGGTGIFGLNPQGPTSWTKRGFLMEAKPLSQSFPLNYSGRSLPSRGRLGRRSFWAL